MPYEDKEIAIKEAYNLLDATEQEKIQEIGAHHDMIINLQEWLSEEANMVFDMIMSMEPEDSNETIKELEWDESGSSEDEDVSQFKITLS